MKRPRIFALLFGACGIWQIGLGLYFMVLRPPLLPEDGRDFFIYHRHL